MLWFVVVEGARVRRAPVPMPMPTASPWRAKPRGEPKVAAAPTVLCAGIICVGIPRSFSLFLLMLLSSFGSHQNRWSAQIYVFSPQSFFFVGMFHALLSSAPEKDDDCWWCVSIFFFLFTHIGQTFGYPIGRRSSSLFGNGDFRWGFCTWLYVLCPFVVLLLLFCLLGRFSAANNVCIYGPRHQIRRPGWQWSGVRGKEKRRKKYNDAAHLVGPTARNSPNDPTRRPEGFCLKLGPVLVYNVLRFWRLGAPFRRVNSKSQNILLFLFCWF